MKIHLFACLLLSFFTAASQEQKLPDFSLQSISGDMITAESLKGKPVYINIWETWCGPCILEIPALNKLKQDHPNTIFLAITPASKEKTLKFLKKHPFDLTVIYEADQLSKKLLQGGYPTHVFVDRHGNMSFKSGGVSYSYHGNDKPSKEEIKQLSEKASYEFLHKDLIKNEEGN